MTWEGPAGESPAISGNRPGEPLTLPLAQVPTSAEGGREVPGGAAPRADDAGESRVALQDVAGQAAVADLVSDVEPGSVQHPFQDVPWVPARVAGQHWGRRKERTVKDGPGFRSVCCSKDAPP